ncbi:unnamed protein product [Gulo gulo]|uniref:Uncharacterized protein n=1 Tax=Gulo gulo TaxID=48420 RepID=A0A9X9LXX8_GULGU|nr:unnamed protein product [Gulo gulo]
MLQCTQAPHWHGKKDGKGIISSIQEAYLDEKKIKHLKQMEKLKMQSTAC